MQPESRSKPDSRVVRVSEYYETCSTRDRARRFYPKLLKRLEDAPSWGEVHLTFHEVDLVSPSFLDELLVTLAEERPELAKRLVIEGLSPFAAKRLKAILGHRNLSWTLQPRETEGHYRIV